MKGEPLYSTRDKATILLAGLTVVVCLTVAAQASAERREAAWIAIREFVAGAEAARPLPNRKLSDGTRMVFRLPGSLAIECHGADAGAVQARARFVRDGELKAVLFHEEEMPPEVTAFCDDALRRQEGPA
jgi:hypothetical protein